MATLSGDGCEIWVERFIVGMPDAHEFVKARRTP
jgi:hypothetical protein